MVDLKELQKRVYENKINKGVNVTDISKKDNILKNNNLTIPEKMVIFSVTLALPIPCIKEANILSK